MIYCHKQTTFYPNLVSFDSRYLYISLFYDPHDGLCVLVLWVLKYLYLWAVSIVLAITFIPNLNMNCNNVIDFRVTCSGTAIHALSLTLRVLTGYQQFCCRTYLKLWLWFNNAFEHHLLRFHRHFLSCSWHGMLIPLHISHQLTTLCHFINFVAWMKIHKNCCGV